MIGSTALGLIRWVLLIFFDKELFIFFGAKGNLLALSLIHISTSSARARVDEILKNAQITEYFDDSICGDEVTHGKPNPEIFLTACEMCIRDRL